MWDKGINGNKATEIEMTEIQKVTSELRQINNELRNDKIGYARLVRLSDRRWDLEARYDMLLRQAGFERP